MGALHSVIHKNRIDGVRLIWLVSLSLVVVPSLQISLQQQLYTSDTCPKMQKRLPVSFFLHKCFFKVEAQIKANAEFNNSTIWIKIIALSHQGRKTAQTLFEFPIEKLANITVFCFCFFGFYFILLFFKVKSNIIDDMQKKEICVFTNFLNQYCLFSSSAG